MRFSGNSLIAFLAVLVGAAVVTQSGITSETVIRACALSTLLAYPALYDAFVKGNEDRLFSLVAFVASGIALAFGVLYLTSPVEVALGTIGAFIAAVPLSNELRKVATSGINVRAFAMMHFFGLGLIPVAYGIGLAILYWTGSSPYQLSIAFWIRFILLLGAFWRIAEPLFRIRWLEVYIRANHLERMSRDDYLRARDETAAPQSTIECVATAAYLAYRDFMISYPVGATILVYAGNLGLGFCIAMSAAYVMFALVFFNFPKLLSLRRVEVLAWSGSCGMLVAQVARLVVIVLLIGGAVVDTTLLSEWRPNFGEAGTSIVWIFLGVVVTALAGNLFTLLKTLMDQRIIPYYRRRAQWAASSTFLWWVGTLFLYLAFASPWSPGEERLAALLPFADVTDLAFRTSALTATTSMVSLATLFALGWFSVSDRLKSNSSGG